VRDAEDAFSVVLQHFRLSPAVKANMFRALAVALQHQPGEAERAQQVGRLSGR
jgi:hypothetical protein